MASLPMTAARFVKAKLSKKNTADGFLSLHREFLNKYDFLKEILEAYDQKEILPSPTLMACQVALAEHIVASQIKTAKSKEPSRLNSLGVFKRSEMEKVEKPAKEKMSGYTITVMVKKQDRDGNVIGEEVGVIDSRTEDENGKVSLKQEEAIFDENDYGSAERKADRVLFSMQNSLYAIIENNAGEKKIPTKIERGDAIARTLKGKPGVASKRIGHMSSSLKPKMRARNDHCSFSRG